MNSFQYFQIKQDKKLSNPIQIFHFAVEGDYTEGKPIDSAIIPKQQVAYFEYSPQVEMCDVLFQPTLLIENSIKKLWRLYEPQMKFKGVQVFANDPNFKIAPIYWCQVDTPVACMIEATEQYPDKTMKQLAIQFRAVQGRHIFQVAGLSEPVVVVSLPVAESMLKRSAIGFELQAVELV